MRVRRRPRRVRRRPQLRRRERWDPGVGRSAWVSLAAGAAGEVAAGTSYAFGLYSEALKARLGLTQRSVQLVVTFGQFGNVSGVVGGLLYDRFGPKVTAGVGSLAASLGYLLVYRYATAWGGASGGDCSGRGARGGGRCLYPEWQGVALMCAFQFLWAGGSLWIDTAAVSTAAERCPRAGGRALGLLKAQYGLSAGIVAQLYAAFFAGHRDADTRFLLFLAVAIPAVTWTCVVPWISKPSSSTPEEGSRGRSVRLSSGHRRVAAHLRRGLFLVGLTAVTVAGLASVGETRGAFAAVVLTLVASVSVWLSVGPVRGDDPEEDDDDDNDDDDDDNDDELEEGEEDEFPEDGNEGVLELEEPLLMPGGDVGDAAGEDAAGESAESRDMAFAVAGVATESAVVEGGVTLFQAVGTPEFWLSWVVLVISAGAGVTVINEAGAMAVALGAGPSGAQVCVTVLSASNCLGRVLMGEAIDGLKSKGVHLPALLGAASSLMACAATALSIGSVGSMYAGCALAGLAYGTFFSIIPNLARDLFGLAHIGALYGAFTATNAFGSYIFNVLVAGTVYADAEKAEGLKDTDECLGASCFRVTFVIMAVACMGGACISALLALRTMPFYHRERPPLPPGPGTFMIQ